MIRVWHPYTSWECYRHGMWRIVGISERAELLEKTIDFTGNASQYGMFMQRIVKEWPITCEHHLTDSSLNRKAFVGHAAACMAIASPEDVTRQAWGQLSAPQQHDANAQAIAAITEWEIQYSHQNTQLRLDLEKARVSA